MAAINKMVRTQQGRGCPCFFSMPVLFACIFLVGRASAANWAQVSGPKLTNIAQPVRTEWLPRWGHQTVALIKDRRMPCDEPGTGGEMVRIMGQNHFETGIQITDDRKILLIGGDDFDPTNGAGGYHNDIWSTTGANWGTYLHQVEKTKWGDDLPKAISKLTWQEVLPDKFPGRKTDGGYVTYEDWIACAAQKWTSKGDCDPQTDPYPGRMFSARRNFATLSHGPNVYVLGGRAREHRDLPPEEAIGGILGKTESTRWREKTVLKNDIWMSGNGAQWTLVNPGCRVPQADILLGQGKGDTQCVTNDDCDTLPDGTVSGTVAQCVEGKCVCPMWSQRERHQVAIYPAVPEIPDQMIYDNYQGKKSFEEIDALFECPDTGPPQRMYVFGGYVQVEVQKCGDFACGGRYRGFMNDVWRTKLDCSDDQRKVNPGGCNKKNKLFGEEWELVVPNAPWPGRGGHSVVIHSGLMVLFGGKGGSITDENSDIYYNDVWSSNNGLTWTKNTSAAEWSPRANHVAASVAGEIVIVGGITKDGLTDETWSSLNGTYWEMDFSETTPQYKYVNPASPVVKLESLSSAEIDELRKQDIYTIADLAGASKDKIMALRGGTTWYNPMRKRVEDKEGWMAYRGGPFRNVCPHRARAEAVMRKCAIKANRIDGEEINAKPGTSQGQQIFYGGEDMDAERAAAAAIIGGDPDGCHPVQLEDDEEALKDAEDLREIQEEATLLEAISPQGTVNLTCKYLFSPRAYHAGVVLNNRFYISAGNTGKKFCTVKSCTTYQHDMWYRDNVIPGTSIVSAPISESEDYDIVFQCSEVGCTFEYQIYELDEDDENYQFLFRNWTETLELLNYFDIIGRGKWRIEARAIDPAGNKDPILLNKRNMHTWIYTPPLPWHIIGGSIAGFFVVAIGAYLEVRRRRKKKAMERYAVKRMRRKFKGIQKNAKKKDVDWKKFKKGGKK